MCSRSKSSPRSALCCWLAPIIDKMLRAKLSEYRKPQTPGITLLRNGLIGSVVMGSAVHGLSSVICSCRNIEGRQLLCQMGRKKETQTKQDQIVLCKWLYVTVNVNVSLIQGWTNPGHQVAVANKFCTLAPDVGGFSVRNLLHVSLLALRILRWLLEFWKIYAPLP
jgi:hypothetical protein